MATIGIKGLRTKINCCSLSTCISEMQSLSLVNIVVVLCPADVVYSRRRKAMVLDLARQRQVHSNIGVVVEWMSVGVFWSFSCYQDERFVGNDLAPSIADMTLVVALEGVDIVALDRQYLISSIKFLIISKPMAPANTSPLRNRATHAVSCAKCVQFCRFEWQWEFEASKLTKSP